jgi:hypothetical protein
MVGNSVWVGGRGVPVGSAGTRVGPLGSVSVDVQASGWKGVGVAEAFGAAVTRTKERTGCAWAEVPHPARVMLARSTIRRSLLIAYG